MAIHISLLGDFGKNLKREYTFSGNDNLTINSIFDILQINRAENLIILLNGKNGAQYLDVTLNDGDAVTVLPLLDSG